MEWVDECMAKQAREIDRCSECGKTMGRNHCRECGACAGEPMVHRRHCSRYPEYVKAKMKAIHPSSQSGERHAV